MSDEQNITADEELSKSGELEECKKKCEEYLNGLKRAKADYINFKNETEKRREEMAGLALMTTVAQFIPLMDNLKKAFQHLPDELKEHEWVRGIEQIWKQMKDATKSLGVEEFSENIVGAAFDPTKHYAIGEERIDTQDDSVITQEASPGYTFRGAVLVPAKVIVNKKN